LSAGAGLTGALAAATARLAQAGVPSARHDAQALAAHVLGMSRAQVVTAALRGDDLPLGARFDELVTRRARRVPLQHLTGEGPFRDLVLAVGAGVFVPRPETEVVAHAAIDEARRVAGDGRTPVVVDLCTGSGAIALAVAMEVPGSRVHAVELSTEAHAWARRNVDRIAPGVDLREGDAATAFADLDGEVDVVVSNPPYIPPGCTPVDPEVRDHDPGVALYGGGPDGLDVPRQVVATAARLLRDGGLVVIEHGDVQQDEMIALLQGTSAADLTWGDRHGHRDLADRPRFVTARRTRTP
jgi:release factor glutamine methyltransferase